MTELVRQRLEEIKDKSTLLWYFQILYLATINLVPIPLVFEIHCIFQGTSYLVYHPSSTHLRRVAMSTPVKIKMWFKDCVYNSIEKQILNRVRILIVRVNWKKQKQKYYIWQKNNILAHKRKCYIRIRFTRDLFSFDGCFENLLTSLKN